MQDRFPYRFSPRVAYRRRRATRGAVAACGVAVAASLAVGTGALGGAAGASSSRFSSVVAATRKAILAESAVRVTSRNESTSTRKVAERAQFDAGRSSSIQRYDTSGAHIEIRLTPKAAWFSGNKAGLTTMLAMPANIVTKVGTKWVAVKKSEAQYKDFSSAVLSAIPADFLPAASAKSPRLHTATRAGKKLDVLSWTTVTSGVTNTFKLEVAGKGRSLPVSETRVAGKNKMITEFSHWNEHVVVRTPTHTIDFAKL